ncbi:MAG: HpcH/HpaI aldolase family protein [Dehalococcoidia bacterium]
MIENSILKINEFGKKANVFELTFPSLQLVEIAIHVGFDAIHLDGEHGTFSETDVDNICRVANGFGKSVTARVPDNSPHQINLYLDRGIQGIIGPHINSKEEARKLVDACLFPPSGQRSWGGGRGTEFNDDKKINEIYDGKLNFSKWSNSNMLVIAQIESKEAFENIDEILSVKELTGITGGPNDFAASLGFPGDPNNNIRVESTNKVELKARESQKIVLDDIFNKLSIMDLMHNNARDFCN